MSAVSEDTCVSVAICTWNRAPLLSKTLSNLVQLTIPRDVRWECVVIDNNSTDATPNVINSFARVLPIKHGREEKQGLSHARNAAIDLCEGDYIIWTDDDVLVDTDWLSEFIAAFRRHPSAGVFGGIVAPWFESQPPAWLQDNISLLSDCYAVRNFGERERELPAGSNPFGASMAFKSSLFGSHRFDPELGRRGSNLIGGEEEDLIDKMRADGTKVIWVPGSRVRHYIAKDRMNLSYVRRYFTAQGYLAGRDEVEGAKRLLGIPLWLLRKYIKCEIGWRRRKMLDGQSNLWLREMVEGARCKGQIRAWSELVANGR